MPTLLRTTLAGVVLCAFALSLSVGPVSAQAQGQGRTEPKAQQDRKEAGERKHPRPNSVDRSKNLDFLFSALKTAPDADSAKLVETRILALWLASGSDTADLLMGRVKTAIDGKDVDLALQLLDMIIELRPEYAEAWNRRATLHFTKKDIASSLYDIRQVLAREPRHFGAWAGLGLIMQEYGEDRLALDAFRRALELHPHLPKIGELVKTLTEKIEGRGI